MINKQSIPHLHSVTLLLLIIFCLFIPTTVNAAVHIISEPGVNPTTITEIQQTVDAFNSVTKNTMNVSLDNDIRIIICPNREKLLEIVNRELSPNPPKTSMETIYASSAFTNRIIFVDESGRSKKTASERAGIIGSYLFRYLSLQLNSQTLPNDIAVESRGVQNYIYWIDQGMSDYAGALVAEKLGLESVEKWKRHKILLLRGTLTPMTQNHAFVLGITSWANFLVPAPALKADLMACYLLHCLKAKDLTAVAMYYQRSSSTTNISSAWDSAFGLQYDEFLKGFVIWYNREVLLL